MSDKNSISLPITFHGASPDFIELVKKQADNPSSLTEDELKQVGQVFLNSLAQPPKIQFQKE